MKNIMKQTNRAGVNALLDHLKVAYALRSDAALARLLGLTSPMVSKLRAGSPLTPGLALRIHECTDMPLKVIYEIASRPAEVQQ